MRDKFQEIKKKALEVKVSDKKFGISFSIFFLILGIFFHPYIFLLSLIFLILSFTKPQLLHTFKIAWLFFGQFMQSLTNPIFFSFLYFFVLTPMGLFLKLFKKDLLDLKMNKDQKSYWIKSPTTMTNFKDQF